MGQDDRPLSQGEYDLRERPTRADRRRRAARARGERPEPTRPDPEALHDGSFADCMRAASHAAYTHRTVARVSCRNVAEEFYVSADGTVSTSTVASLPSQMRRLCVNDFSRDHNWSFVTR